MKLYSPPGSARAPSLRGRFYVTETRAGTVVSAWPKHPPRLPTPDEAITRRLFAEAIEAMKRMDAGLQTTARQSAKGTPYLPRDALMASLYGRGPVFYFDDGKRWAPMANRIDLSSLIDGLGWTPGGLLVRKQDFWDILAPGNVGDVLRIDPAGAPDWNAPPSVPPQSGTHVATRTDVGVNAGAQATKGPLIVTDYDIDVQEAWFLVDEVAGGTYVARLATVPVATITVMLGVSDPFVAPAAAQVWRHFAFAPAVRLVAGTRYAMLLTRTDATAATANGVRTGSGNWYGGPIKTETTGFFLAGLAPAVGTVLSQPGVKYVAGMRYAFA